MLRTTWLLLHAILILGGFTFLAFLAASLAYGRIPLKFDAQYVIILGSGLIGDKVPPLLASRLDKAISLAQEQDPPPKLIPSGGQGHDEALPEGIAMTKYLVQQGVPRGSPRCSAPSGISQVQLTFIVRG